MKKTFLCLSFICALWIISNQVYAQANGNANYNDATRAAGNYKQAARTALDQQAPQANIVAYEYVEVTTSVLYNAKADHLVAIFNLVQVGENSNEVNSLMNERIKNFSAELQKAGIKPEQIFIDMVSFVPVFEIEVEKKLFSKNYIEVPKGFELQKNIHVAFADERKMNDIMTAAALFEIYDLVKVDYMVNDSKKIYQQMQDEAMSITSSKIEKYKKMGINISNNNRALAENKFIVYPNNRYESYQAFSSHSLEGKKKQNTQVAQVRKPVSMYYNKLNESNFDMCFNPQVLEPVVQYAYTLKIRCPIEQVLPPTLPTAAPLPTKEYWIITPTGELKMLPK